MRKKRPEWQQFEQAVAAFASAIDRNAKVTWNAILPDKHTGEPRQRDVWIEAKVGGHYSVNVLVSCKRYKQKLHQGHVDAFSGEIQSSAAHKGVLYSFSGFGANAIKKAQALGIDCCMLYSNKPADIPAHLVISHYCCHVVPSITPIAGFKERDIRKWEDAFSISVETGSGKSTLLNEIAQEFRSSEKREVDRLNGPNQWPPRNWQTTMKFTDDKEPALELALDCNWTYFGSDTKAILLNGSYSVTSGEFKGSQTGPAIDTRGSSPGREWTQLAGCPNTVAPNGVFLIRYGAQIEEGLHALGAKAVPPQG